MLRLVSLLIISLLPFSLAAQDIPTVPYISGGIGANDPLRVKEPDPNYFTLKLTTALTTGNYLADVEIIIYDTSGDPVIHATTEGPFFYAHLAPGNYQLQASYDGVMKEQALRIPTTGRREVVLRWQGDEADAQ